jgi:hypothetical protein
VAIWKFFFSLNDAPRGARPGAREEAILFSTGRDWSGALGRDGSKVERVTTARGDGKGAQQAAPLDTGGL